MGTWRISGASCESVHVNQGRVGYSALLMDEHQTVVRFAVRNWPDEAPLRVEWSLLDADTGRMLGDRGGGWGGVTADGRISGDGFWIFETTNASRLSVRCTRDGHPLLEDVLLLSVFEPSVAAVVAKAADNLPGSADRIGHLRSAIDWPSKRAVADRIDGVVSSTDLTGLGLDVLAIEHWGPVRRLIASAPTAVEASQHHLARWWTFEIDETLNRAVMQGSTNTDEGALLDFLLLPDPSHVR